MRKIVILLCLLLFVANIFAQPNIQKYVNYNNMMDSLLVIFGQKIEQNLATEEYSIPKLTYKNTQIVGYSIILEVYFKPLLGSKKCFYILMILTPSEVMQHKYRKQSHGFRIRQKIYSDTFRHDIDENNKLPYDLIDYFRYQFITTYNDAPENHALYGDYKFSVSEDKGFEIIEKNIEILKSKDEIERKHRSNF